MFLNKAHFVIDILIPMCMAVHGKKYVFFIYVSSEVVTHMLRNSEKE